MADIEPGFSPQWLALREPADHKARKHEVLQALAAAVTRHDTLDIVDLGCGTGSNLRAMALAFTPQQQQRWRLCDYDEALLAAARATLLAWADEAESIGETLILRKENRRIEARFLKADLRGELAPLFANASIITASAFFDLVSETWMAHFAEAARAAKANVYAPLIYNGLEVWQPPHIADGPMLTAFCRHQQTDKGFGRAAGPKAAKILSETLTAQGYTVSSAASPWVINQQERPLIDALAEGGADAVRSLSIYDPAVIADWRGARRAATSVFIGHHDVLGMI